MNAEACHACTIAIGKEVRHMKKIWLYLAVICLVLVVGSAFGDTYTSTSRDRSADPDSMINALDPTNAPGTTMLVYKTRWGFTVADMIGEGGSAAGGMSERQDSVVNYLDPTNAPSEKILKATTGEVMRDDPNSLVHQISPAD